MKHAKERRRLYGEHFTSVGVFEEFILPEVKEEIYQYRWVDLFCGEGNLILPMLNLVPEDRRVDFFKEHVFLFDIQKELVERSISNAVKYGIPEEVARKNITQRDSIKDYPTHILDSDLPVFHVTNPPYLYIGYIAKHKEARKHLDYFQGANKGYQDLYQLALMNDLRNNIKRMVYIIPSNFLFGFSVSNKVRDDFFPSYSLEKAYVFERKIFEFTGINVVICFFNRKKSRQKERIAFKGKKISDKVQEKHYVLKPENHYKAGDEFSEFVERRRSPAPLTVSYYLKAEEVASGKGDRKVEVVDANAFNGKTYDKKTLHVNDSLYEKIMSNTLFIRTVDTGSHDGRVGLYSIKDVFDADGIFVSKPYRTQPIHVFLSPQISKDEQALLKKYFNLILEYFREKSDSDFMTTYKYSQGCAYTRKYLGLTQARKLIETYPTRSLGEEDRLKFARMVEQEDAESVISFIAALARTV